MAAITDKLSRPLRSLRVSVTDRCNLRCTYCMPEQDYTWLDRSRILSFEEIARVVDVFATLGVSKVRLTGGEPLLRRHLSVLVRMLANNRAMREVALTTNGILLADRAQEFRDAGLSRVTLSLDTLRPERFRLITRSDAHAAVLRGLEVATATWPGAVKLDAVVERGVNDDELLELLAFARDAAAELRFIEYMDVGGATRWAPERVVSRREILARIEERHGPARPIDEQTWAPADRFELPDGTVFGVISSTTEPFCRTCDRSRLTADGMWYMCLYAREGVDLRRRLREGASDEELGELLRDHWTGREDRGAERRLEDEQRTSLVSVDVLKKQPHLEMHTRGG